MEIFDNFITALKNIGKKMKNCINLILKNQGRLKGVLNLKLYLKIERCIL